MFETTRDFIRALDDSGELRRITAPVSPVLEVAEIADRVSKYPAPRMPSGSAMRTDPRFHPLGGHALLFENVEGSRFPLLINAWGSYHRMEMALGCHDLGHTPGGFEALAAKIGQLVKPQPPSSLGEIVRKAMELLPLLRMPPRRRSGRGLCQEVVITGNEVDLTQIPMIRCWPRDGDFESLGYPAGINDGIPGVENGTDRERRYRGRYITFAGIHTIHADEEGSPRPSSHNIGMYRVQLLGKRHMAMHWHIHHDGARHWRSWRAIGRPMPVAIVLGGESVLPYAATAPLPPGISELLLAGFLNRGGIPMVRGRTVPLWIPANAEIVIEGYVSHEAGNIGWDPRDADASPLGPGAVFEGPFGDHTGFYSMPDRYPLLEVTAITHRRNAVYPTTIVGMPPQEDYYLGKATERIFLPLLRTIIHDIEDYDLPMFGAFHNCAFIKIRKQYPLQARRVMHGVWGAGQMAWTKTIFVVDEDCDVHDTIEVLRRASEFCDPARDVEMVHGPLDILDHAAPRLGAGMKIGFDCTRKIRGEEVRGVPVPRHGEAQRDAGASRAGIDDAVLQAIAGLPHVHDVYLPHEVDGGWMFLSVEKIQLGTGVRTLEAVNDLLDRAAFGTTCHPRFVVCVEKSINIRYIDDVMFHWCANCDVSRDLVLPPGASPFVTHRIARLCFDATPKQPGEGRLNMPVRAWPPVISMDEGIKRRVRDRWEELGLSG